MSLPPLSPEHLIKPRHFELRLSLLYAALFVPIGLHLPYFPLWLEGQGFSPEQIAIVLSAPMFLRMLTTPLITAMADRARDRANVFVLLAVASLTLSAGYFLEPTYWGVLAVSLTLAVFWAPHAPLADSLALSGVRRFGSSYARMRIWGSAAFLFANFGGGAMLAHTGADAVPAIFSSTLAVLLLVSLFIPRLGRPRRASPLSATELQSAAPKLLSRHFLFFVGGAGLISASHGFLYGFASIYWKSIGLGETLVGLLWAFAVLAEVGMFMVFNRIFGGVSTVTVLALAGAFAIIRWIVYPLIWPFGFGVTGFFIVQALHAFSTGLILLGIQKHIAGTVAEERTGAAQGISFFATGFFMAAVTLLSGPLYDHLGANGFFAMAGVAAAGLLLIGLAFLSAPERRFRR